MEPSEKFKALFRDAVSSFGADCCNDMIDHHYEDYKAKVYEYVAKVEEKANVRATPKPKSRNKRRNSGK
jgi:hypothetical protein